MKNCIALLLMLVHGLWSFACTTFLLTKDGHHIFGRNYDWVTGNGMVMTNARGLHKTGAKAGDGESFSWQSVYGSISFNQYGKEFPTGGMNEKGLVVELMWLDETAYPRPDKRPALRELQWIQYQLDCSSTLEEVIQSDKDIRIWEKSVPIHFLISDASGKAASIEFLDGKMVVHKDQNLPFPVLSNSVYDQALQKTKESRASVNEGRSSEQRFATACSMVQHYQQTDMQQTQVDYAFSILNKVAQEDFTKWSIVYDITARQVYFFTGQHQERKTFSFSDFDFSCKQPSKAFQMNSKASGNIAQLFTPLSPEQNRKLIEQSARETKPVMDISKESIEEAVRSYQLQDCK